MRLFDQFPILVSIQAAQQVSSNNTKTQPIQKAVIPPAAVVADTPKKPSRTVSALSSKFKTKSSISIKGGLQEKKVVAEESNEEDYLKKPKTPFNQEQLEKVWLEYSKVSEQKGQKMFANILKRFKPQLEDNFLIVFKVEHSSAEMEFNTGKVDLLRYLRLKLNNYHLSLEILQEEITEEKRLYTNRDKYNRLADKNESLKEMMKKFNLEIDF